MEVQLDTGMIRMDNVYYECVISPTESGGEPTNDLMIQDIKMRINYLSEV